MTNDQWHPIKTYPPGYVLLTDGDNIYGGEWDDDHWNIGVAEYDPSNWSPKRKTQSILAVRSVIGEK